MKSLKDLVSRLRETIFQSQPVQAVKTGYQRLEQSPYGQLGKRLQPQSFVPKTIQQVKQQYPQFREKMYQPLAYTQKWAGLEQTPYLPIKQRIPEIAKKGVGYGFDVAFNLPSFAVGGLMKYKKPSGLIRGIAEKTPVFEELPKTLKIKSPVGKFAVGLGGEILTPGTTELARLAPFLLMGGIKAVKGGKVAPKIAQQLSEIAEAPKVKIKGIPKELEPLVKDYLQWGKEGMGKLNYPLEDYQIAIYLERKNPRKFGYWATVEGKKELTNFREGVSNYLKKHPTEIPIPSEIVSGVKKVKPEVKPKRISVKEEFKVGDILDPQGKTNMVGRVKIREITGNTLKFVDSEGTQFDGMPRSLVRTLIEEGSWKRVQPKIRIKAPEAKLPVQVLKEQLKTPQKLPISPEVAQPMMGGLGKETYAPSTISKTLAGIPPTGKPSKPIIPQEKYAFNVNLEKLGLTPKEKQVLKTTVDTIKPELEKIKGKKLSNREVINAAKKSEILTKISTREETLAAEAATLKARQRLVELDKEIGQLLQQGKTNELQAKMKDLVEGLRVVSSNAADTGRKLQSLSIKAGDESVRSTILKEISKVEKDTDRIIREATRVDWNNANSITSFYRKFVKPSTMEILDEYRYNNMLSNPRTHLRNAFSNLIQTFITRPATLTAMGKPREAAQYYQGALKGLPKAVEAFKNSFTGKTPIAKPDISRISSGKFPKFFTIPTRAMEAADRFFSALIKEGELARGATSKQAEEVAEYSLFRSGLFPEGQGKLLNAIDSLTAWTYKAPKAVRWFVPFIRTPMNFAKQWLEYSPTGLATLPGSAKKKEQLAKFLVGSVITTIGAKFALDDNTTWSVPTDPKQKELFYASGRKPFSVKIGNKWIPMIYAGPFAFALALPAAVKYYNDESRTALTDSQIKKLTQSVMSMAEFLSGQTFLEGINNFVKFFSGDVDYSLPGNLAFTAGQLIPHEGLVRYISTIVDPIFRKGKTFEESLKKNIPFLSKTLEPYTTPMGELSRREPINYILPYDIGIPKTEYEPLLQQRTQKLQQNALVNQLTKEGEQLVTGRTKPMVIGDKETTALLAYYGFYDLINKEPKSSIEQKILNDKIYQKANDVLESEEIDDDTKEKIFQAVGLTPEDVTYDYLTRLADDLQTEAILTLIEGKTGEEKLNNLLEFRKPSEGSRKPLLTDTIINKMVKQGILTSAEGNLLESYEWDEKTGKFTKKAGKGKKPPAITIKKATMPSISFKPLSKGALPTIKLKAPPKFTTAQKQPVKLTMPEKTIPAIRMPSAESYRIRITG